MFAPFDSLLLDRKRTRSAIKLMTSNTFADLASHPYVELPIVKADATPQTQAEVLRELLQQAIESLKPTGAVNPFHKSWRAYLVITRQYLQKQDRQQIARDLAIDLDTYNHSAAEAVDAISHWLDEQGRAKTDAPRQTVPTAAPAGLHTAPPRLRQKMFGRDDLLQQIKAELIRGQDVAIFGLPGMGKSTLLSALAYDTDLLAHFADGVLWAGLGQYANVFVTGCQDARNGGSVVSYELT